MNTAGTRLREALPVHRLVLRQVLEHRQALVAVGAEGAGRVLVERAAAGAS